MLPSALLLVRLLPSALLLPSLGKACKLESESSWESVVVEVAGKTEESESEDGSVSTLLSGIVSAKASSVGLGVARALLGTLNFFGHPDDFPDKAGRFCGTVEEGVSSDDSSLIPFLPSTCRRYHPGYEFEAIKSTFQWFSQNRSWWCHLYISTR